MLSAFCFQKTKIAFENCSPNNPCIIELFLCAMLLLASTMKTICLTWPHSLNTCVSIWEIWSWWWWMMNGNTVCSWCKFSYRLSSTCLSLNFRFMVKQYIALRMICLVGAVRQRALLTDLHQLWLGAYRSHDPWCLVLFLSILFLERLTMFQRELSMSYLNRCFL